MRRYRRSRRPSRRRSSLQDTPADGGDDPLHQEREQWTDGANAFALAPGRIMLYARNRRTVAALGGIAVVAGLLVGALAANYLLVIGVGR